MFKVAVVGSGLMGGGIAQTCATSGYEVVNVDIAQAPLEAAEALITKLISKKVEKGKMTQEECDAILGRLTFTTDFGQLAGAKIIIEAVPEKLEIKQSTFEKIDAVADEGAILLTNTSGINIDDIAQATERPESVLGMHFFYPAPVMKLAELIRGSKTSDDAFNATKEFAASIGKTTVDAPNQPGFIVNRLIVPYQNEGAFLVMEGCTPEDVDNGMKLGCNHPMGPCELMDFTGIDVVYATMKGLYESFGDEKYRPCPLLKQMIDEGKLGRKSGQGFYTYE